MKAYNKNLDETFIFKKLPNGLNCYIITKEMYNEKRAMLTVKYGSVDERFKYGELSHSSPPGVAHFLEHKLFDGRNGSAFDSFSKLGSYVNAFTSFNNTAYYFSCDSSYEQNLENLLEFVSEPYFKDESIEKEMGVIEQEISMYDDNPGWVVYFNLLSCLYENHPARLNIAGTSKSISKINKDELYKCYNNFYVPENICLICAGNVDAEKTIDIAGKYFKNGGTRAQTIFPFERSGVYCERAEASMKISNHIFQIGFKDNCFSEQAKRSCHIKIMLDLFIGASSDLKEILIKSGLADDSLSFDYVYGEGYGYATISGESRNPDKLLEICLEKAEKITKSGFQKDNFERIRKKQMGCFIRGFNSIEAIVQAQGELCAKNTTLFDCFENYGNACVDDINRLFKDIFRKGGYALSILKPELT